MKFEPLGNRALIKMVEQEERTASRGLTAGIVVVVGPTHG